MELSEEELEQQRLEEDAKFMARLQAMTNEDLAKMLLNKSLIHLVRLINDDMATAADISAARAILKDNNIGIVPTRTNAAGALEEKLKERSAMSQQQPGIIPVDDLNNIDINDFIGRH
ncbi:hypothetical protein BN110_008 [Yersinia phage phiR8-01]|uniref:Uncharacterized protein n=1 Tax=Yersinia phage phiR8-01 TaxID=1206556 RepID=I7LEB7_9CAUD|nr:terminase small subunit [Yersinia phage phiR8-01]CCI88427.2 hypothetical protein BN110_008 [Yersinia phage phiR8-01]